MAAEDIGDHLLVGGAVEHVAVLPVANAQHFGPVSVVAPAFAPQIGGLQGRHQHWNVTGANLLFVNDIFDFTQNLEAQRQPGIDAGRVLLDHPCTQHHPVTDNLRLGRIFAQHGHKVTGQAHGAVLSGPRSPLIRTKHCDPQSPNRPSFPCNCDQSRPF